MATTRAALTGAAFIVSFATGLSAQNVGDLKISPGFDLSAIDRATNACDDFYQFSCGTWLKNNPIPADQSSWDRFSEINENNRILLRGILEKAAAANGGNADTRKIGDYYAACMDEKTLDAKGLASIQPELDRVRAIRNSLTLSEEIARLHTYAVDVLFNFTSGQ